MPRGDGTGPAGVGPMTGRCAGYCAGNGIPGYANAAFGRGMACGGRARRRRYISSMPFAGSYSYANEEPMNNKAALAYQADMLEKELKNIRERLSGLERD